MYQEIKKIYIKDIEVSNIILSNIDDSSILKRNIIIQGKKAIELLQNKNCNSIYADMIHYTHTGIVEAFFKLYTLKKTCIN